MSPWLWTLVALLVLAVAAALRFAWRRHNEDPMTKGRRALRSARRQSEWLKKRPFSDQYDGNGYGNDGAAGRRL